MGVPVPFRVKKGTSWSPWKAVVDGKTVELASPEATLEEASTKLRTLIPEPLPKTTNSNGSAPSTVRIQPLDFSVSAGSTPSSSESEQKPKPGDLRKGGLSELSPSRLKAFREQVAVAIAAGNVSLDRALVSIFRDKVPFLTPEQYLLLSTGWEFACEQYFVNGVIPPWLVILLGNAMVCTALVEHSEPKKVEEPPKHDVSVGNTTHK